MTALVAKFGALGVFALMVPESACIPIPSEVTLMCAGFGVREGWMSFWAAVLAATAGNLLGSLIAYAIGRGMAGRVRRTGRAGRALAICDGLFARHGDRAIFLARLMPLARTFVSLPAGYARAGLGRFVLFTAAGCALWAAAFAAAGMLAGAGWSRLSGPVGDVTLALALAALAVTYVRRKRRVPSAGCGSPPGT